MLFLVEQIAKDVVDFGYLGNRDDGNKWMMGKVFEGWIEVDIVLLWPANQPPMVSFSLAQVQLQDKANTFRFMPKMATWIAI